jgi:hypothetical protein
LSSVATIVRATVFLAVVVTLAVITLAKWAMLYAVNE